MGPSFFGGVGAIENSDFVVGVIDIFDEVVEADACYFFPYLIALGVVVVEEIFGHGDIVVNKILPSVVSHIENLASKHGCT